MTSDKPELSADIVAMEDKVLRDESVALGARLFRSVRLKGDRLSKDDPHWITLGGKSLPRVVVVDTAGKKVGGLEAGDLSASNLFKVMKKAAAKTYKADLEKVVKESRAILDDIDAVSTKQAQLVEAKKDAKPAKLKEIEAEEAALAKQLTELQARDADLLKRTTDDRKVSKN